jgi:Galactose-1-phosphate uridyl transferase, N-terminal domain
MDSGAPGFDASKQPHRRFNPLLRDWILVSPHRTQRPWQGQLETTAKRGEVEYDPTCYMCPGNTRSTGRVNPKYENVFVFDNDFPALLPDGRHGSVNQNDLLIAETETGICRVLCFSPKHHLTLSMMQPADIRAVVDCWADQFQELGGRGDINYVQIFENRGAMMGASNPHPHCQIWSTATIPNMPRGAGIAARLSRREGILSALRLFPFGVGRERARRRGERLFSGSGSLLGSLAVRGYDSFASSRWQHRRTKLRGARRAGRHSEAADDAVRQFIPDIVSVLDGISSAADRREGTSGVAFSRASVSAIVAFGDGAEIHGGI